MTANYHFVFHFPSGYTQLHYENIQYHIGDKIVFEGEQGSWIIEDIQHQFRDKTYMMTNIILAPWQPK